MAGYWPSSFFACLWTETESRCAFESSRLNWNALLTKKLPLFLSRLNEINGSCEKILPVSGSFLSHLKLFRMMNFTAWL